MFKVVAYYTFDTGYEDETKNLIASCKKFNLDYHIKGIESLKNWKLNCGFKPTFILNMLYKFPEHDIVYVDCDAVFCLYPSLFDSMPRKIGVHYKDGHELLSGTIFIPQTGEAIKIIVAWIDEQARNPQTFDQRTLQAVLNRELVYELPPTYTQIFDLMAGTGDPVIKHMQASRRFKRFINAT